MADISKNTGYQYGARVPVKVKIDSSTSAIEIGDILTLATAGYFKQAGAGDEPLCVAMEKAAAPSADGDITILADFSQESVYAYAPATGSVTQAIVGKTFDVGGAQSADIATGTDDSLYCVAVDTVANLAFVQIRPTIASID